MSAASTKPWKEFKVSGGKSASHIPKHIAALGKSDCVRWDHVTALSDLYDPGKVYSAAAKAIPLLANLLKKPATPNKDTVLVCIGSLLCASTRTRVVWGLNLEQPEIKKFYARGAARDIWKATWEHRDTYVELLSHSDAMVRSAAALLLAFDFDASAEVLPAIEARTECESDEKTRASLVLSVGLLRSYAGRSESALDLASIASDKSESALVRGAAVIAQLYSSKKLATLSNPQRDVLVEWCGLSRVDLNGYAWYSGETDLHCARVVEGRCVDGGLVAAEILAESIRRSGPKHRGNERASAILELAFEQAPDEVSAGPFMIDAGIREPSEFSARHKPLLEVLASYSFAAPFLSYGIPAEVYDRRRWLGLEPPGPLERVVEVKVLGKKRKWPIWRCLKAQQASEPDEGVDVEALLGSVLSKTELLEVMIEYAENAYSLRLSDSVDDEVMARSREMLPWAKRYLNYIARIFTEFGGTYSGGAMAGLTAMKVLLQEGRDAELVEKYDVLIDPSWRKILEAIPLPRRESVVTSRLQALLLDDPEEMWSAGARTVTESVLNNLDLYPTGVIANALFDLRDHVVSHDFTEFLDLSSAIEQECQKVAPSHRAFHKVVKRRMELES